jgi:hypothetical protein
MVMVCCRPFRFFKLLRLAVSILVPHPPVVRSAFLNVSAVKSKYERARYNGGIRKGYGLLIRLFKA